MCWCVRFLTLIFIFLFDFLIALFSLFIFLYSSLIVPGSLLVVVRSFRAYFTVCTVWQASLIFAHKVPVYIKRFFTPSVLASHRIESPPMFHFDSVLRRMLSHLNTFNFLGQNTLEYKCDISLEFYQNSK